jgi:hypothetical protein
MGKDYQICGKRPAYSDAADQTPRFLEKNSPRRFELPFQNNNQNSEPNPSISSKFVAIKNKKPLDNAVKRSFLPECPLYVYQCGII